MTTPIQQITDIAQKLKETYDDLNGRFKEHEEKKRELNTLASAEQDAMLLIEDNRTAIRVAYKALTGIDIDNPGSDD